MTGRLVAGVNVYTALLDGIAGDSRISRPTRCGSEPSYGISASFCRLLAKV